MSEPTQPAAPSAASRSLPQASPRRRAQRWTDTGALLLVGASLAAVVAAATPSLLRAAGLGAPREEEAPWRGADHLKLPTAPLGAPGNPISAPRDDDDDDEPHLTQLERDYPDGMWPGRRRPEERERDREIFGALPGAAGGPKPARALGPLKLFKDPLPGAGIVAMVAKDTPVQILREVGDWVFIRYRGAGDPITGWVQKSEISVR